MSFFHAKSLKLQQLFSDWQNYADFERAGQRQFRKLAGTLGVTGALLLGSALPALSQTTFYWEADPNLPPSYTPVNGVDWNADDTSRTYTNVGGSGIDVTLQLIDPDNQNLDSGNSGAGFVGSTQTNSSIFGGAGQFTFGMTSDNSSQTVSVVYTFSKPVILQDFLIGDIDSIGDGVFNAGEGFQDEVMFSAQDQSGNNVPITLSRPSGVSNSIVTISGQTAVANYSFSSDQNFAPTDQRTHVLANPQAAISQLRIDYSNGPSDDGFSTDHGIIVGLPGGLFSFEAAPLDYGDAPDSYDTTDASNGPSHIVVSGIHLGTAPDSETDAETPLDGSGDGAEDDGITVSGSSLQSQSLTVGDTITLDVTALGNGVLNAWIDWNGDGVFDDATESIADDANVSGGTLSVTVPNSATVGTTYARFRYSSDTGLGPTGAASDGEVEDYQVAIASTDQFACPRAFYQIINNQLKKLDPLTGQYLDVGSPVVAHYNATGYNPVDDFIYGYGRGGSINNRLVQIAQDGTLTNLGVPTKVGGVGTLSNAHSGDFDDSGNLWLRSTLSGARIFRLNVTTNEYVGFALSRNLPEAENVADWVYIDGKLYGGFGRTLYIIDLANQTIGTTLPVTTVSVPDLPAGAIFGAGYTDSSNNLYLSHNAGALYQVLNYDTPTPSAIRLVNTASTSFNDGMSCPDAPPPFDLDFGDAPDTAMGNGTDNYSTLLSDSGPFHLIDANLYLGGGVTPDTDGFGDGTDSNNNASDDTDDAFGSLADIPTTGTYDLTNIPVNNANSTTATLHAWIDFDKNGQFAASEYQSVSVPQGTTTVDLSWSIPGGTTDGTTYARFRLTTDSSLSDTAGTTAVDERSVGLASNGEVEDYQVAIAATPSIVEISRPLCRVTPTGRPGSLAAWLHNVPVNTLTQDGYWSPSGGGNTYWDTDGQGADQELIDGRGVTRFNGPGVTGTATSTVGIISGVDQPDLSSAIAAEDYVQVGFTTLPDPVVATAAFRQVYLTHRTNGGTYQFAVAISTDPTFGTYSLLGEDFQLTGGDWSTLSGFASGSGSAVPSPLDLTNHELLEPSTTYYIRTYFYNRTTPTDRVVWDDFNLRAGDCLDWGDAPDSHNTTLALDGPRHIAVNTAPYLGTDIDIEGDGQPDATALGDDSDEDGATLPATMTAGETLTVPVNINGTGHLNVWFDWNNNNDFNDTGEQIVVDQSVTAGTTNLSIAVPSDAVAGTVFARFRLCSAMDNCNSPTGLASDGEVEDYQVAIAPVSTNPDVVLVKRITAINGTTTNSNDSTDLTGVVNDGTANSPDDEGNWPTGYLLGQLDAGLVKPGDQIEYTVYFLNAGNSDAENVRICDWIQPNQSLVTGLYDESSPGARDGNDIELSIGGTTYQLTAASDAADRAMLTTVGDLGSLTPNLNCNLSAGASNSDSVLVLDITGTTGDPTGLTTLPGTTGQGTPNNAYGFFRFTTQVDE